MAAVSTGFPLRFNLRLRSTIGNYAGKSWSPPKDFANTAVTLPAALKKIGKFPFKSTFIKFVFVLYCYHVWSCRGGDAGQVLG